ncbi:MAG: hypothetical protein WA364_23895 [Candidatus Nitrosopolaris sp.]
MRTTDLTFVAVVMMKKNKNTKKINKTINKSFETLKLYEDEPIIFHNNSDRNQTITNTLSRHPDKMKIMLVIPSR